MEGKTRKGEHLGVFRVMDVARVDGGGHWILSVCQRSESCTLKHNQARTSLVVLWLRIHMPYKMQEARVRTGHGITDWFQIGKGVRQSCIVSPCLFNFYAEYIMRNAGLEEAQAGINCWEKYQ